MCIGKIILAPSLGGRDPLFLREWAHARHVAATDLPHKGNPVMTDNVTN